MSRGLGIRNIFAVKRAVSLLAYFTEIVNKKIVAMYIVAAGINK